MMAGGCLSDTSDDGIVGVAPVMMEGTLTRRAVEVGG